MAELTGILRKYLDQTEIFVYAFIDVEGAFDHTSHEAVMGGSLGKKRGRWHILMMDGKVLIYKNSGNKSGRRHHQRKYH